MSVVSSDPTQRLLELAAYLKRSLDVRRDFDLDTVTAELPGYLDDAPRDADGSLRKGTRQLESLRRKFRRDLDDLQGMLGIEVQWEEATRTYRVLPPFFSTGERQALVVAATIAAVDDDHDREPGAVGGAVDGQSSEVFLHVDAEVGLLRDAIAGCQRVTFRYNGKVRELEPYALAYRDDDWYVAGHDRAASATRTFRLERIEPTLDQPRIEVVGEVGAFELPVALDPAALFRFDPEEWGTDPVVTAQVRVAAEVAARFQLVVRGNTLRSNDDDDSVMVEAEVRNYGAFRDRVLGFREHARVVGPPALVAEVDDWLRSIAGESA